MKLTKYLVKTRVDRKITEKYNPPKGKGKISKTNIKRHLQFKTHPHLQVAIRTSLKNKAWLTLAKKLAGSTRLQPTLNLSDIDQKTTAGDTVVIPGKVLAVGDITKKVRIASLYISSSAKDKLKKTKSEWVPLYQEIQSNPKAEGIKVLS
ncbi:hypothetical protein FJZ18_00615 [Candidatus Pacearchaeota archaeon]|nr:hypothetical protein [Candidatus Pacearchaeota archaeon]